jgi:hypothetical protein
MSEVKLEVVVLGRPRQGEFVQLLFEFGWKFFARLDFFACICPCTCPKTSVGMFLLCKDQENDTECS